MKSVDQLIYLIYWKRYHHTYKDVNSYLQVILSYGILISQQK